MMPTYANAFTVHLIMPLIWKEKSLHL